MNFTDIMAVSLIAIIAFCAIDGSLQSRRNKKELMRLTEQVLANRTVITLLNNQLGVLGKILRRKL